MHIQPLLEGKKKSRQKNTEKSSQRFRNYNEGKQTKSLIKGVQYITASQ